MDGYLPPDDAKPTQRGFTMTNTRTAIPTPPYRMPRETRAPRAPRTVSIPISSRFVAWLLAAVIGGLIAGLIGSTSHTDPSLTTEAASKTVDCRTGTTHTCSVKMGGDTYRVTFDGKLYVVGFTRTGAPAKPLKFVTGDCRQNGTRTCGVTVGGVKYLVTFTSRYYLHSIKRQPASCILAEDGSCVRAGFYDRTSYPRPGAVWDGTAWVTK
jgi:hypothetical protein